MPFEILETLTKSNMPPVATISYMRAARNGKHAKDAKPRLSITIPTTICGLAKSKHFQLLIGTGNDRNKVRIKGTKDEKSVAPTELAHAWRFIFGYLPKLGEDIFDGEKHPVAKITEEEFEITVPVSLFAPAASNK